MKKKVLSFALIAIFAFSVSAFSSVYSHPETEASCDASNDKDCIITLGGATIYSTGRGTIKSSGTFQEAQ